MIRFSVVTPSYNQGRFIERTICSVLTQGYPNLDYVLCDGASTDQTATVLERYADQARIIIEPDSGQADAVNKGMRAGSGDVIGWLNSDDTYCPGALLTVAAFFGRHHGVDVVYGDANFVDVDDRVVGRYYTEHWNARRLLRRPFLSQPAVFFRRALLDRCGYLDENLHFTLDYEYWLRLAHAGAKFAYLPYTLANARLHPATKTETQGLRVYDELAHVLRRYVQDIPDQWILTQTHAILREQHPAPFANPFAFACEVVRVSVGLSMHLNGHLSAGFALGSVRTLSAGLAKSVLGRAILVPEQ